MEYSCIPEWMQPTKKDPFDYKLRSKDEVKAEHRLFPPKFNIIVAYKCYTAGETDLDHLDFRERVVRPTSLLISAGQDPL